MPSTQQVVTSIIVSVSKIMYGTRRPGYPAIDSRINARIVKFQKELSRLKKEYAEREAKANGQQEPERTRLLKEAVADCIKGLEFEVKELQTISRSLGLPTSEDLGKIIAASEKKISELKTSLKEGATNLTIVPATQPASQSQPPSLTTQIVSEVRMMNPEILSVVQPDSIRSIEAIMADTVYHILDRKDAKEMQENQIGINKFVENAAKLFSPELREEILRQHEESKSKGPEAQMQYALHLKNDLDAAVQRNATLNESVRTARAYHECIDVLLFSNQYVHRDKKLIAFSQIFESPKSALKILQDRLSGNELTQQQAISVANNLFALLPFGTIIEKEAAFKPAWQKTVLVTSSAVLNALKQVKNFNPAEKEMFFTHNSEAMRGLLQSLNRNVQYMRPDEQDEMKKNIKAIDLEWKKILPEALQDEVDIKHDADRKRADEQGDESTSASTQQSERLGSLDNDSRRAAQEPNTKFQKIRVQSEGAQQPQVEPGTFTLRTDTRLQPARECTFTGETLSKTTCSTYLFRVQDRYLDNKPPVTESINTSVTPSTKGENLESLVIHVKFKHQNRKDEEINHGLDKAKRYTVTVSPFPSSEVIKLIIDDMRLGITPPLTLNPGSDLMVALRLYEYSITNGLPDHHILHPDDLKRLQEDKSAVGEHYRKIKDLTPDQLKIQIDSSEPGRELGTSFKDKIMITSTSPNSRNA